MQVTATHVHEWTREAGNMVCIGCGDERPATDEERYERREELRSSLGIIGAGLSDAEIEGRVAVIDVVACWVQENERRWIAADRGIAPIPEMPTLAAWTEVAIAVDAPAGRARFPGVAARPVPAPAPSAVVESGAYAPAGAGGLPVARAISSPAKDPA